MQLELNGKSVLITGGSKGIGLASALQFSRDGAHPIIVSRLKSNLQSALAVFTEERLPPPVTIELDLSEKGASEKLFKLAPNPDILINNAGAIPGGSIHEIDEERWRSTWELKLFGYINMTRLYLKMMENRESGVICNIIGLAGVAPRDYICGSTANAALIAFTKGIGGTSVNKGVRVFGINPAPTRSDRMKGMLEKQAQDTLGDASRWSELIQKSPMGRLAEPDEIARVVVFGCSPLSGYISGSVFNIDAGQIYAAR
jgi:3-oxoacyl-[acyl-carrier protein] reductase